MTTKDSKWGGARPNSGQKPKLKNPVVPKVYIDRERYEGFVILGGGNFSAGVRIAYDILKEKRLLSLAKQFGEGKIVIKSSHNEGESNAR